jgi:hypothetical protein
MHGKYCMIFCDNDFGGAMQNTPLKPKVGITFFMLLLRWAWNEKQNAFLVCRLPL